MSSMSSLASSTSVEVLLPRSDNVLGPLPRRSRRAAYVRVPSCHAQLQRLTLGMRSRRIQRSRFSGSGTGIDEPAVSGFMGGADGANAWAMAEQEESVERRPESDELAGDERHVTAFFSDELRQAVEAMKERSRALAASEITPPGQRDEISVKDEEAGLDDRTSDTEDDAATLDALRYEHRDVKSKLPLESNGPPMAILQPYLVPDLPNDAEGDGNPKLRRLPLIVPYKMRPFELPSPSRRHRFRSIISKREGLAGRGNDLDLTGLAAKIQALPAGAPVSRILEKFVWRLKKGRLGRPVREVGRMQLTGRVIEIVSWLQAYPHLWPDDTILRTAIQVLVEEGEVDSAVRLWKEAGSGSEGAVDALLFSLIKAGKMVEAASVAEYMREVGWKVDGTVRALLMLWACRAGDRQVLESFLSDVKLWELKLKLKDYTTLVASCSKLGLEERVGTVYKQFKISGLRPDAVFFMVLLSAYGRTRKHQEAVALFADIANAGCAPTLYGYKVLLDSCSKLGKISLCSEVLGNLRSAGLEPSTGFHDALMQAYNRLGSTISMENLRRELQETGPTSANGNVAL